jgi:tetratricopeptide (TPR) repeat protein
MRCCKITSISSPRTRPGKRPLGVRVDATALRRARLEAGLTLAQVAGKELSRQAIHLVEVGKARPSINTLEIIASRTGQPISSFLLAGQELPPTFGGKGVQELQRLCLEQQFSQALDAGIEMLKEGLTGRVEANVLQYVGQALVKLNRPDEALPRLERAQLLLADHPDPWLAVECADWVACALYLKEDSRARQVAEDALRLCRETKPRLPGTEARILEHLATIHVHSHSYDRAITYYEEALAAAGSVRDLSRMGRTYHGLGIAYQNLGDLERASEYTNKALAFYALERDSALIARGENELGLLLMRQGDLKRAEELFRSALSNLSENVDERAKSHVLISLAEVKLAAGEPIESIAIAAQAVELSRHLGETLALSSAHQVAGAAYSHLGRFDQADAEFSAAIRVLANSGFHERLAESHAQFAEILEARGDATAAASHWRDAARLALKRDQTTTSADHSGRMLRTAT